MKINKLLVLVSTLLAFNSLPFSLLNSDPILFNNSHILKANEEQSESLNLIKNKSDLLDFINNANSDEYSKNKTFSLLQDIDLEGATLKPIPIFAGTLNGNNHTIKNFKIDSSASGNETGFIRILNETGSIKNLTLDLEIEVKNDNTSTGGFVGTNKGTISNCVFKGTIKARHIVGGIAGENETDGKILNSKNEGHIIGKIFSGGIVGFNKGTVSESNNSGIINDIKFSSTDELTLSNIGGISGFNQNKINDCENSGLVGQKQVGGFVGGISGSSIGQITNCLNHGEIKGNINIGGIVGYYAEFANNEKDPTIFDIIELAKKILGDKNTIENNETKKIKDKSSSLKYCFNDGFISGNNSVGGIVGYSSNPTSSLDKKVFDINNCLNEGSVEANKENLGGIVGNQLNGKVSECFNIGNIHGKTANYVGGINGFSGGEIEYCFAINDMIGNKYVGGIGGSNYKLHDCYSISKIDAKDCFVGALVGEIDVTNENVFNNFYVNDDFYGFDNVDYQNKSTKVNKEELASKQTLNVNLNDTYFIVDENNLSYPLIKSFLNLDESVGINKLLKAKMIEATKFGSYVNFIDEDGNIIKKIFVEFNKDLDLKEVPEVPLKEGFFSKWSEFNNLNITKNLYIKPIYDEIITTIGSSKGANPTVLIQGEFYDTTKVVATTFNQNILKKNSKYTYIKKVTIELKDNINEINKSNLKYKISLPSKYEKMHVATYIDDKLTILDSKIDGGYIVFDGLENDTYYLLDEQFANINNPYFIITIVFSVLGGVLIIGGITFLIIHKKRKKLKNK